TPLQPGWALGAIYYHPSVNGSGNVATARQITVGRFNPTLDLSLSASLQARPDLLLMVPSYVFKTSVLGGQASVLFLQGWGRSEPSIDATLTAILGPLSAVRTVSIGDSRYGFSDFGAQGNLRWNFGVHNFMTYAAANAPTAPMMRLGSPISASGIGRSTAEAATPILTRRPDTNSRPCSASPTISGIRTPITRTASACISTGALLSSSRSSFTSALSATGRTSSPLTSVLPRSWVSSSRASLGSGRRPGTCSR